MFIYTASKNQVCYQAIVTMTKCLNEPVLDLQKTHSKQVNSITKQLSEEDKEKEEEVDIEEEENEEMEKNLEL